MKIENKKQYSGVYSLLLTAFNEDKTVDFDGYSAYVEWQASQKPDYLFAVCGSSEMAELELDERLSIAATAVKHSCGVPVFATANLEKTLAENIEEVKKMEATGVNGLVLTTHGYGDDDAKAVEYLSKLADETSLPVMLYEFPGYDNAQITGKAYGELAKVDNIIGIKDTTCTMPRIIDKIEVQGDSSVLQANVPFLLKAYQAGARGVVATPSSCGGAIPMRRMYDAFFVDKDYEAAKKYFEHLIVVDNGIDSGFMASAKFICQLHGVPMQTVCRDGRKLSAQRQEGLKTFFDYAKANGIF